MKKISHTKTLCSMLLISIILIISGCSNNKTTNNTDYVGMIATICDEHKVKYNLIEDEETIIKGIETTFTGTQANKGMFITVYEFRDPKMAKKIYSNSKKGYKKLTKTSSHYNEKEGIDEIDGKTHEQYGYYVSNKNTYTAIARKDNVYIMCVDVPAAHEDLITSMVSVLK